MLSRLKKILPEPVFVLYHRLLAMLAAWYYRHPSQEMVVIGVTGTNGKTTTTYFIAKALEAAGATVGCTTTALIKIADKEQTNYSKMTMQVRFALQKLLRQMRDAGCTHVVIETSSQGLIQSRHIGIAYDIVVFTNLTPEHIEAHGGFEAYKAAKKLLFTYTASLPPKKIHGQNIPRMAVLNADSEQSKVYEVPSLKSTYFSLDPTKGFAPTHYVLETKDVKAQFGEHDLILSLPGAYNLSNAVAALCVTQLLGFDLEKACQGLSKVKTVPGRFQRIEAGQLFDVIIDYAPEPESFEKFYEAFLPSKRGKVIHVLGSCGGGRDAARRPVLGRLAARYADYVIVTNEDPYDDEPMSIIHQVAEGAREGGKNEGETLWLIEDRVEAIQKAVSLAQPGDAVVLTGKGNEPWICLANGEKKPWSEEATVRQALANLVQSTS